MKLREIRLEFEEDMPRGTQWISQSIRAPHGYKLVFSVQFVPEEVKNDDR